MPIKKHRLFKKTKSKSLKKRLSYKLKTKKNKSRKSKSRSRGNSKSRKHQKGGFGSTSCDMVSVKESGFSLGSIGNIPGIDIAESRASIFKPNCKPDTYQAMTP